MRTGRPIFLAVVALAALVAAGCAEQAVLGETDAPPAVLQAIPGSDLKIVTLSADATRRLGIETAPVTATGDRLSVPAAAILYDPSGVAWVYTSPSERAFVRAEVTVRAFEGADAILASGPPAATQVVTVGVPELYGTENGVGEPE
jgi:hypothetical protein